MHEKKIKVAVLLSAYNGREYIEAQLDSIVQQDFDGSIDIYIREDGSGKSLCDIIQKYHEENRKIIYYEEDNLGPQRSFLKLIKNSGQADYYFFADQDDVWKLDKISRAVSMMEESTCKYRLYCSDYTLTNSDLNVLLEKNVNVDAQTFNFLRIIFYNEFPGCTMAFNYNLKIFLQQMDLNSCMMHDSLALCVASVIGEIIYDEYPSILHRIHGDNVVGYGHKKIYPVKWIKEKLTILVKKEDYDLSEMARRILEIGEHEVHSFKEDILLLSNYKKNYKGTMRLLNHEDSKNKFDRTTLSIRCKILFHLF